ncbi:hypothetical protein KM043_018743 [Ampulex compressa]|nr:hypothetical protein KM043_018743 [Ampulex compressa]
MQQEDIPTILKKFAAPAVINQDLILALIKDQGPKGEAGKLFVEDGIKLEEIEEIRIEFINVLRIDHLWIIPNIVKLKLSNNIIEKIENLDVLVHLKELDLSFNRIRVMEGLNHLVRLEVLLLYNNEIDAVKCIDDLQNLVIFSIGNNKIKDWDHVMYLRKFKKLRSLNTCGNPCVEGSEYLEYLFAFLPQLIYFQYKMITNDERQHAVNKHLQGISNVEEVEAKEKKEFDVQQELKRRMTLHYTSYVEYLEGDCLFLQMFENDEEGKALSMVNEDTQNAFKEYGRTFSTICQELFELGLKEKDKRTNEIELFNTDINKGKEIIEDNCRT